MTTNKYTDPVLGTTALTDLPINNLSPVPTCPVLGHVATQVNIHRVPEPTILVVTTVTFSPIFFTVTKSYRWSCDNILAHTGVPIPLVTVALSQKGNFLLFCHSSSLAEFWSCDNTNILTWDTKPYLCHFAWLWSGTSHVTQNISFHATR